jgi:hypothetical protein
MIHGFGIESIEVLEQRFGRSRGHEPFCRGIVEVLEDDMDADQRSRPAKAVQQVYWHGVREGVDKKDSYTVAVRADDAVVAGHFAVL